MSAQILLGLACPHFLRWAVLCRAWERMVHITLGTTTVGLLVPVLVFVVVRAGWRMRQPTHRQWWLAIIDDWKEITRDGVCAFAAILIILFIWNIYRVEHEKPVLTSRQMAEYVNGTILAISNDQSFVGSGKYPPAVGVGFWVSTNGYALTCMRQFHVPTQTNVNVLVPLFPIPNGTLVHVATAFYNTPSFKWGYDPETGMLLLWVPNNPFQIHPAAGIMNSKIGTIDGVVEKHKVPAICKTLTPVGETIYLVCIDTEEELERNIRVIEGRVEGLGTDASCYYRFIRIHTSIPFKPIYLGAPLVNVSGEVVGIVADSKSSQTVVIPSIYFSELLQSSNMPNIKYEEPGGPPVISVKPVEQYLNSSNLTVPPK